MFLCFSNLFLFVDIPEKGDTINPALAELGGHVTMIIKKMRKHFFDGALHKNFYAVSVVALCGIHYSYSLALGCCTTVTRVGKSR